MQLAPAWTTDWISDDGRRQAARLRHRAARAGQAPQRRASRLRSASQRDARLPALRQQRHRAPVRLRLHGVQGAVPLPAPASSRSILQADLRPSHEHCTSIRCASRASSPTPTTPSSSRSTCPPSCARPSASPGPVPDAARRRRRQDLRRSYSICAGVDDGELRVGVRKVPGGVFSTWVNDSAARPATSLR